MPSPTIEKGKENVQEKKKDFHSELRSFGFRERVCDFSLGFWAIRPSELFGTRRKVALRSEANT